MTNCLTVQELHSIAKRMGFSLKKTAKFDTAKELQARQMVEFAEVTLILLSEVHFGFEPALRYCGTGVYSNGFSWRCIGSLTETQIQLCKDIISYIRPLYPAVDKNCNGPISIENNDLEDWSVCLDFKPNVSHGTCCMNNDLYKAAELFNVFGDLEVM